MLDGGRGIVIEGKEAKIDIRLLGSSNDLGIAVIDGEIGQGDVAFVLGKLTDGNASDLDASVYELRYVLGGGRQEFLKHLVSIGINISGGGTCYGDQTDQNSGSDLKKFFQ